MNGFKKIIITASALAILLTTCDMPMGLGDPVDVSPPLVFITSPTDNFFFRGVTNGSPITLNGKWTDDVAVTSMSFDITASGRIIIPSKVDYTINPNGEWSARIVILGDGNAALEYTIRVTGRDKFGNSGGNQVTVRIDIVPPWVDDAYITRHPGNGKNYIQNQLREKDWTKYSEFGIFNTADAYRNITYDYIDDFQNETFTLDVEISSVYEVGASRLYLLDDEGNYINTTQPPFIGDDPNPQFIADGIAPRAGAGTDVRNPKFDIKASDILNWKPGYASGPHYIKFEVHAWNEASWDPVANKPVDQDPLRRIQEINGTVWYPEADLPHIYLDRSEIVENILTLDIQTQGAIYIDFFDDDILEEIYLGLIPKDSFDNLRSGVAENTYLQTLTTNASARTSAINACINDNLKTNRYTTGSGERYQRVALNTGAPGEYRLIALAKEDKPNTTGWVWNTVSPAESWSVYPALRVQVQDTSSPLIIIESPESENIFPTLQNDGRTFKIRGYTLDQLGVEKIQIAWIPEGSSASILQAETALAANNSPSVTLANGVKIINNPLGTPVEMTLNGKKYIKTPFEFDFDIVDFFQYVRTGYPTLQNLSKLFVIHAYNNRDIYKTFRLTGYTSGPQISIEYPRTVNSYHNNNIDLNLRMTVERNTSGILVDVNSIKIEDSQTLGAPFNGAALFINNAWQRTVESSYILASYNEGVQRTYNFEAKDILGNTSTTTRNITLSDRPVLKEIVCTTGAGTYGIGEELSFEARYTMPVRINPATPAPRLKLYQSNNFSSTPLYAEADTGSTGGSSITFRYLVKEGDNSALLHTFTSTTGQFDENNPTSGPINNHASILATNSTASSSNWIDAASSLQGKTVVKLDGVRPQIIRASFVQTTGNSSGTSYYNNGKTITLKLYTDEAILVTGTPAAYIAYGSNTLTASFTNISRENERSVLNFTTAALALGDNVPLSQLSWGGSFITYDGGAAKITDGAYNDLKHDTVASRPTGVNLTGGASAGYPTQMAYIKTTKPAVRSPSIFAAATGGTAITPVNGSILRNTTAYLRVTTAAEANCTVYYSLEGGNNQQTYGAINSSVTLADVARTAQNPNAHFKKDDYAPSSYPIVVWQEDIAGNRSDLSATTTVEINSRAPELLSSEISLPNGWYKANTALDFKFTFSDSVTVPAGSTATISLAGIDPASNGTITITNRPVNVQASPGTSLLTIPWSVTGVNTPMKNIKITSVSFSSGMVDSYGNPLVEYNNTASDTDENAPRNITNGSDFNITRPDLGLRSARPQLSTANPAMPTATGTSGYNGGLLASGATKITLNFDAAVRAVPGGYITIRPYGNWAVPPVLSIEEFDSLYNYAFDSSVKTTYQNRLRNVDGNGFPNTTAGTGRTRTENLYEKNTHGIITGGTNVVPDTSTKMILHFDTDLYTTTNANNLRTVFNAAKWKWQEIHVTSGAVSITGSAVEITIDALPNGRIWEVIVDDGAFQDEAGNLSMPVGAGTYRFWSSGTAVPVVRTDKISYDGNGAKTGNSALGFVSGNTATSSQNIPPIDTRMRIDCETPGANIVYETVRTVYQMTQATATPTNGRSQVFVGTAESNGLHTPSATTSASLTGLQSGLQTLIGNSSTPGANQKRYQATDNAGIVSYSNTQYWSGSTGTQFFFVGDAWGVDGSATVNPNIVTAHSDPLLYTGRRDYVVAVAKKNQVAGTTNTANGGPALDASTAGMEGVYKTTLLYRDPARVANNGTRTLGYRLLVQGFDMPLTPVTAGFPLRDADSNSSDNDSANNLFSKSAYRLSGTFNNQQAADNHYIWVTWEIVTDWYQKGKLYSTQTSGNYLNNNNQNQNAISATYGGIIYRYQQGFYN